MISFLFGHEMITKTIIDIDMNMTFFVTLDKPISYDQKQEEK